MDCARLLFLSHDAWLRVRCLPVSLSGIYLLNEGSKRIRVLSGLSDENKKAKCDCFRYVNTVYYCQYSFAAVNAKLLQKIPVFSVLLHWLILVVLGKVK